jgi:dimethylhistidine N-methyltransferase
MAIYGIAAGPLALTPRSPLARFRDDVLAGLRRPHKELPCKYFYDARGSELFDQICAQPEYYLTRTEVEILRLYAPDMAGALGPRCLLIEYGSGSALKTPLLLECLEAAAAYVPVDISREHLLASAALLAERFGALKVCPVWADFTEKFRVPTPAQAPSRWAVWFPGSTIGNFGPQEAGRLLAGIAEVVGAGGGLLIGVDLRKPAALLEPAYNDAAGVTAAFNRNLLARINRELGADFDPTRFEHRAFFNDADSRIEMHLVSSARQAVHVAGATVRFAEGESIRTECSYKYSREAFARLADEAGLHVERIWTDPNDLFSVQYLVVRGEGR